MLLFVTVVALGASLQVKVQNVIFASKQDVESITSSFNRRIVGELKDSLPALHDSSTFHAFEERLYCKQTSCNPSFLDYCLFRREIVYNYKLTLFYLARDAGEDENRQLAPVAGRSDGHASITTRHGDVRIRATPFGSSVEMGLFR